MVVLVERKSEKTEKKRLWCTSSSALNAGYVVCYNRDSTTGDSAAAADISRAWEVEKPTSANLKNVAGVIARGLAAVSGGQMVDIFEPRGVGSVVTAWSGTSTTINSTRLGPVAGQWYMSDAAPFKIATAGQTIDRSNTAGVCQVTLDGVNEAKFDLVTASARTAAQLPTKSIWDRFPLEEMRRNPFAGSLFEADFRHGDEMTGNVFADAAEGVYPGTEDIGTLKFFVTTDNQAAECQWPCAIVLSGGNEWAFECRFTVSLITNTKGNVFAGLMLGQDLAGNLITDAAALQADGSLGFQIKEGDGDKVDFVYDETSRSQQEHDDDYVTPVAATYNTFGMYFNGTTIQQYLDGVATGTAITAVEIAHADFPTAKIFVPTFAVKCAVAADDYTATLDWMVVAQMP